jgi:hypothetical protein
VYDCALRLGSGDVGGRGYGGHDDVRGDREGASCQREGLRVVSCSQLDSFSIHSTVEGKIETYRYYE